MEPLVWKCFGILQDSNFEVTRKVLLKIEIFNRGQKITLNCNLDPTFMEVSASVWCLLPSQSRCCPLPSAFCLLSVACRSVSPPLCWPPTQLHTAAGLFLHSHLLGLWSCGQVCTIPGNVVVRKGRHFPPPAPSLLWQ